GELVRKRGWDIWIAQVILYAIRQVQEIHILIGIPVEVPCLGDGGHVAVYIRGALSSEDDRLTWMNTRWQAVRAHIRGVAAARHRVGVLRGDRSGHVSKRSVKQIIFAFVCGRI